MPFNHSDRVKKKSLRFATKTMQAAFLALMTATWTCAAHAADAREVQSRVAPVYPELAKRMRITGVVKVEATVDANGKVKDVKAVSGNHVLMSSAEDAVRRWKFAPGSSESSVDVQVNFSLGE